MSRIFKEVDPTKSLDNKDKVIYLHIAKNKLIYIGEGSPLRSRFVVGREQYEHLTKEELDDINIVVRYDKDFLIEAYNLDSRTTIKELESYMHYLAKTKKDIKVIASNGSKLEVDKLVSKSDTIIIKCLNDNKEFLSITGACEYYNISNANMRRHLKSNNRHSYIKHRDTKQKLRFVEI